MSEQSPSPRIVKLDGAHDRSTFDCGKSALNAYIQTLASQHERRDIGRTFVLTDKGTNRVLGFYTLAASAVSFEDVPDEEKVPRYPIPVIKLARLAVDVRLQGKKIGEFLLFDALGRAERISRDTAIFAVEVDAMDEGAVGFYNRYDFAKLKDDKFHLYLTMKKIIRLHLND